MAAALSLRIAALALLPAAVLAADAGALRDPTLPPAARMAPRAGAATLPATRAPVLKMILRSGESRRALLDGSFATIGVGDWIDAAGGRLRVLQIDDHGLLLAHADGGRERLELAPAPGLLRRAALKTPQDAAASGAARSGR